MWLQMVATGVFALALAVVMMAKGLPPIAYTIPERLSVFKQQAVFKEQDAGFGGPAAGPEELAGLRPL